MVIKIRNEKELRACGLMVDPDDPGKVIRVEDASTGAVAGLTTSNRPVERTEPVGTSRKVVFKIVHRVPWPHAAGETRLDQSSRYVARDYGYDDSGTWAWEVDVLEPGSQNHLPLVDHVAGLRRFKARDNGATRTVEDIERKSWPCIAA